MQDVWAKQARANEEAYFRRIEAQKLEEMRAHQGTEGLVMPKAEGDAEPAPERTESKVEKRDAQAESSK